MNTHTQTRGRKLLSVILSALLIAALSLSAAACWEDNTPQNGQSPSGTGTEGGLIIVTSMFASYDFARTLADEVAEISLLVPPGAETHSYEPTPSDIILLNSADVFIYVGGESDAWLDKIIDSLENPHLTLVRLTDLVETVDEVALEGMTVPDEEHSSTEGSEAEEDAGSKEEEHEDETDEHVWTSLRNAQIIVDALADTFAELDADNAQLFHDNAQNLNRELSALDKHITDIVSSAERTTFVFGDRFPFRYFADDYGLTSYAAFPGCSTAVDTNPSTITFLIDIVRKENIPVIFTIELSNGRIAQTIAAETSAQILCFHSVHNISEEDLRAGATYLSLMQENADNLEVALN